jgi:hypothetical protein
MPLRPTLDTAAVFTHLSPTRLLGNEAAQLPQHLLDMVAALPPNVDRKTGAVLITRHMFPVSHRSLEVWPLPTRRVNGRAVIPTAALFEVAYQKFAEAPVVMGGRRTSPQKAA